jgi:hypothetical protein
MLRLYIVLVFVLAGDASMRLYIVLTAVLAGDASMRLYIVLSLEKLTQTAAKLRQLRSW